MIAVVTQIVISIIIKLGIRQMNVSNGLTASVP
jgi:hypothetical protein